MKFCTDIESNNNKRLKRSDFSVGVLFLLNGQKLLSDDDVINQICKMLKRIKPLILHTDDTRSTKLAVFSDTTLKKNLIGSEFLFSFLFSFHKMVLNGTVSHEHFW